MRIYILRHGVAEEAARGSADAARALTAEGREKLRHVLERARGAGVRPSVILTSPLKRALQTAEMAASVLGVKRELVTTDALAPMNTPPRVWNEIRAQHADRVLLAGHEPLLSQVVGFLLRCPGLQIDLKKGALVSLEVENSESGPTGTLKWILTPKLAG